MIVSYLGMKLLLGICILGVVLSSVLLYSIHRRNLSLANLVGNPLTDPEYRRPARSMFTAWVVLMYGPIFGVWLAGVVSRHSVIENFNLIRLAGGK